MKKLPKPAIIAMTTSLIFIFGTMMIILAHIHKKANHPIAANNDSLFAQYFQKDTLPSANYPMLAQAFTDYKNDQYKTLEEYDLENLPNLKGTDGAYSKQTIMELGYYYKGISFLAAGEPDKASPALQWVIDHAEAKDLVWKAQWYQALALTKTAHIREAIGMLQSVSANPAAQGYNQEAGALLQKLQGNEK